MIRLLGQILYYAFIQYLPKTTVPFIGRISKWIRYFTVRLIFAEVGKSVNIEPKAYFGNGRNIIIGDYSGIGKNCRIPNNLIIGKYVMMADEVVILGNNHNFKLIDKPMCFQGIGKKTQLIIEDDVWLGTRSIILSSVNRIGKGSIIGAGTVVTKNIPPYSVVAGNPGKIIKARLGKQI